MLSPQGTIMVSPSSVDSRQMSSEFQSNIALGAQEHSSADFLNS